MAKKCSCGKEIDEKYEKCYDCFKKEKPSSKEIKRRYNKKADEEGFTDLSKEIKLPLWAAIGLFLAGAAIGAWLF